MADDSLDAHGLLVPPARPAVPGGGPQSTADLLAPGLADSPDSLALVGSGGRYTFRELDREVARAARVFDELGARAGDRVAVCLPNDVDIAIHFLASQRLGLIWVGLQSALAPPEKAALLGDCGAGWLLADPRTLDALRGEALLATLHTSSLDAWRSQLAAADPLSSRAAVDPFAPAAIGYTSGTTGQPKGVVHSQHNLMLAGAMLVLEGGRSGGAVGVVLSLTLLNMIVRTLVAAFVGGRALVCLDRHEATVLAAAVEREQLRSLDLVPTLAHDLLQNEVASAQLASLEDVAIGGAGCPPAIVEGLQGRFGIAASLAYGMTEAPTAVARTGSSNGAGSCARAVPQVEVTVVGTDGIALGPGEIGELCVGPATSGAYAGVYTPMLGYWNRPEATQRALRGGCYYTGDLGEIGTDGCIRVHGRKSERILRGGANVHPPEVERALEGHPAVRGAAVFGVPDDRLGEVVVAAVELVAGAGVESAVLLEHAAKQLARYKLPARVHFVEALPRNALGKVVKRDLARSLDYSDRGPHDA